MTATLYGLPGSHAVMAGELMLRHKRMPYRRVNFPPGMHRGLVRMLGFRGGRVPAVIFDGGRRAQGTRELPRMLDEMIPERRLAPEDPRAREAETWADDVLEPWARQMVTAMGGRDPDALTGRGAGGRLGPLLTRSEPLRKMITRGVVVAFRVTDDEIHADRAQTGAILDQVDGWIAAGVLNGPGLRSPDYAIASSLALVEYVRDLRPELTQRPLMTLIDRAFAGRGAAATPRGEPSSGGGPQAVGI
jgi:glutathione S-transferase